MSYREIKFRAWNKFAKEFYPKPFLVSNTGLLFIYNEDFLHTEEFDAVNPTFGLVLQQYTGLKDKNNVEIYEGDILNCKGFDSWTDEVGYFYNKEVKYETEPSGESELSGFIRIPVDREIIGNIFENPELLK